LIIQHPPLETHDIEEFWLNPGIADIFHVKPPSVVYRTSLESSIGVLGLFSFPPTAQHRFDEIQEMAVKLVR
jgi:hypothetical protein